MTFTAMPACNISSQKPAFKKDEKRGQKWARNSSPFLEPSSIGTITEGQEGVANLGTDREMPSNATSSSLDAAGQGKRPEHTFAFNQLQLQLGRPSLKGTVFDRILGPKNGPEDFAVEPSFLCRVCDTWQARRCLQSS